ncbi:MAG: 4-hydroxy-tetrahydrodipicolinate reductase [Anaerovorax sp.]
MKVIITAPRGKMDQLIVKVAAESQDMEIVAGLGVKGRPYIGKDVGIVAGLGYEVGAPVIGDFHAVTLHSQGQSAIEFCDLIIDFSTVDLSMEVLEQAVKYNKPLICGTTGFREEQVAHIKESGKHIPILFAANTSYMVNVMRSLVEKASQHLGSITDVEILDMHDVKKVDAPSGTAKELGEAIEKVSGIKVRETAYHSIRSGDIPSSHTVIFGGLGERLEITHHAYNWECYARGACQAAKFLMGKEAGLYSMEDVIMV